MDNERPFPYPTGWYILGLGHEVRAGKILPIRFMGRELLLWRTQSGNLVASDSYCAHMGTHMGYGGRVEGDLLRCPFHGFCYDCKGDCAKTGRGTKPHSPLSLKLWPCREVNGLILVFHDEEGKPPTFEIPEVDMKGFRPVWSWVRKGRHMHPQDTAENGIDMAHFPVLHEFHRYELRQEPSYVGPHMYVATEAIPPLFIDRLGIPPGFSVGDVDMHAWGLGYINIDAVNTKAGTAIRYFVSAPPVDPGVLDFRVYVTVKRDLAPYAPWFVRMVPRAVLGRFVQWYAYHEFTSQISRDLINWHHRIYVDSPAFRQHEPRIARFREWAAQFYPKNSK